MKKIIIKLFAFLLIFGIIIEPFTITNVKAIAKVQKEFGPPFRGDLRCPAGSLNVDCFETKENDEVISVRVVKEDNNVKITKTVTRKDISKLDEATYSVKFDIEYKKPNSPTPYIVFVNDESGSMGVNKDKAQAMIRNFANVLHEEQHDYINMTLVEFSQKVSVAENFTGNSKFAGNQDNKNVDCKNVGCSKLVLGMNQAYEYLKDKVGDKYIVYFIDGDYINKHNWAYKETNVINVKSLLDNLHANYECIRFESSYYEGKGENAKIAQKTYTQFVADGVKKICGEKRQGVLTDCFKEIGRIVNNGNYCNEALDPNSWVDVSTGIAESIRNKYPPNSVTGTLTDNLGEYFSNSGKKSITIENINVSSTYTTKEYEISIKNPNINDRWVKTNKGFSFTYRYNGTDVSISSDTDPEVYWIKESDKHESCTDSTYFVKRYNYSTSIYDNPVTGIGKTNLNDLYCRDEIRTNLIINNQAFGAKKFTILRGLGIPIEVEFAEQVTCYNRWHQDKYNSVRSQLESLRNSGGKNQAVADKEIAELESIKINYQSTAGMKANLNNYLKNIKIPTLKIKYNDNTEEVANMEFVTSSESMNEANCSGNKCVVTISKKYQIKENCLQMGTGKIVNCDVNSNNQIYGDHEYYFDMTKKSGTIAVQILNTGFSGDLNITMASSGNNTCAYDTFDKIVDPENRKVIYRQIDIKDPFIQQFTTIDKRTIGRNFSNNQYNFVNIIDADIWNKNNESEYLYLLSKTNVENIKRDTLPNDYIGISCYTNSVNKYICPFTRNIGGIDGNNNDYFTSAILKN